MDLIETEYGREGSVLFKLTGTEIDLLISDEEVTDLYIEKCIESLNNLSDAFIAEICIEEPENENIVGFQLSGNCDWDAEHGIEIIILDDNLLYLGAFEDNSPWYDYDKNDKWNFVN